MAETQQTSTLRLVTKSRLYIAELRRRWVATVIDSIVIGATFSVLFWGAKFAGVPTSKAGADVLMLLLYLAYHTILSTGNRQTFGKRYQMILVVDHAGSPLSLGRSALRALVRSFLIIASFSPFPFNIYFNFLYLVDVLLALKNKSSRTLHDQVSDSYVVQAFEPAPGQRGRFIRRMALFYGTAAVIFLVLNALVVGAPTFRKMVAKSAAKARSQDAAAVEAQLQP